MYNKYEWEFNSKIVDVFDEHIKNSIPYYKDLQDDITRIAPYFIQSDSIIVDIGTSTGSLVNKIKSISNNRNSKFYGIDIQPEMIEKAISICDNNIEFLCMDALNFDYTNASVVTSMLSFQFMSVINRQKLINQIFEQMNNSGALFMVEKVKTEILDIHDIYNDIYYDFKMLNFTPKEILEKNGSLRGVMKPLTSKQNINMLRKAGFKKIDIFFKFNNFVGIIAIK